ncbi:putative uncharacterized protein FRMD6-AS1 [Sciurus carolinensis]|uniref:putative uncharacterized protein FRMD6-AS1 n=1 Tax=Sciurus carolinensis TaxID=30640 RepID=UPI001FB27381|nr:putative uncharacterized protein FRMD6-AS1 [Sciurus carolinensis]
MGGPSCSYLTVPGRPPWKIGWWSPLPYARSAGRKLLQKPKFCRPYPPNRVFPRSLSGAHELQTRLRLLQLGTFRVNRAEAALRSFPEDGLPGHQAHTTGGTAQPPGMRAQMLVPAPSHRDWKRQAGDPEQGAGDHHGAPQPREPSDPGDGARRTEHRSAARSRDRPPALAAEAARELRASPAAGLCCPGAPSSRLGVGELRLAEATCSPGARRLDPREREERLEEGDTAFARTGDFKKPSRNPSSCGSHCPADRGHSGRSERGAQAREWVRRPQALGSYSYLEKLPSTRRRTLQLSVSSCRRRACPLHSAPWLWLLDERTAPAPPRLTSPRPASPRLPVRPRGSAPGPPRGSAPSPPEVVAEAAEPREPHVECPARPASDPTKRSREGHHEPRAG